MRASIKVGQPTIIAKSTVWQAFGPYPLSCLFQKAISSDKKQDRTEVVKGRTIQGGRVAMICDFDHQICQSCVCCTNFVKIIYIGSGTRMGTLPTPETSKYQKINSAKFPYFVCIFFCGQKKTLCVHFKPGKISTTEFRIS